MPEFNDYEYDRVRACVKHLYSRENTVTGEDIQEGMCAIMRVDAEKEKEKKALGIGAHIRLLEDALAVNDNPDAWDHGAVIGLLKAVRDGTERIFDQELQNFPWPTGITAQKVKKIKKLVCEDPVVEKEEEKPGDPDVPGLKDRNPYLPLKMQKYQACYIRASHNAPEVPRLNTVEELLQQVMDGIIEIIDDEIRHNAGHFEPTCYTLRTLKDRICGYRIVGEQKERL